MGSSKVYDYSTTPGSNTTAPPDGAPENMRADAYNNVLREVMANLALFLRDCPWLDFFRAYTVSKLSDSTCRIAAVDVTANTAVGRRIKITGASTVYGYILATAFTGGNTDLTVAVDDGAVVPASITKIEVSLLDLLALPDIVPTSDLCANPEFDVWRLGTTITNATAYTNTDADYCADQIVHLCDAAGNVVDISQPTSGVPTGARNMLRATVVTANKKFAFYEPFTQKDTLQYRGKAVSFQIKMFNSEATLGAVRIGLMYSTATGDAFALDPVTAWGAAGTNPTLGNSWAYCVAPVATAAALSTTAQTFKLENVLIPTNANNLAWIVLTDDTTVTAGATLNMTQAQIDAGPRCLPYRQRPLPEIEGRCRFFIRATFRRNVAPADNLNNFSDCLVINTTSAGSPGFSYDFEQMRVTPTVSTFNPRTGGSAGQIVVSDGSTDLANTRVIDASDCHARIDNTSTASGFNNRAYVAAMADARMGV